MQGGTADGASKFLQSLVGQVDNRLITCAPVANRLSTGAMLPCYIRNRMEVDLTPDQPGLSLWEKRERRRAEILAAVDTGEASIAQGEGRLITEESMRQLAKEVSQRGRACLAAEQQ